jgi:hypothetical protein
VVAAVVAAAGGVGGVDDLGAGVESAAEQSS